MSEENIIFSTAAILLLSLSLFFWDGAILGLCGLSMTFINIGIYAADHNKFVIDAACATIASIFIALVLFLLLFAIAMEDTESADIPRPTPTNTEAA